jgi:hypothetical protein
MHWLQACIALDATVHDQPIAMATKQLLISLKVEAGEEQISRIATSQLEALQLPKQIAPLLWEQYRQC